MKQFAILLTALLMVFASFLVGNTVFADQGGRRVEVTITNITRNQIFSPPAVISHSKVFQLFELGQPASSELYPLAEDGNTTPLTDHLDTLSSVLEYEVSAGPVMPGDSVTLEVTTRRTLRFVSVAGMLVTTNDAFFAIRGVRVPLFDEKTVEAEAYDAGSEANTEDCDDIPGPPCGNINRVGGGEGYVSIHSGIHGTAGGVPTSDLNPSERDWRNPVALITLRRLNVESDD